MRAVVVEEVGGPEQLVTADVAEPTPAPGQVVAGVVAAGLNYIDTYHRTGQYPLDLPFIAGLEGVGVVEEVGHGVDRLSAGDRVGWVFTLGSYAEKVALPADQAIPIPDGIESKTAAAALLQGLTAHYLATDTFPLSDGDRCLIHAGAGGVGLLLTQIAKLRGATAITTVGTEEKADLSIAAGADHVVVHSREDFKDAVEAEYGVKALDVVYDGVGASTFTDGLDLLRPRGMMVTFGNASGPPPGLAPRVLAEKGSLFLTRPTMTDYLQTREEVMGRADDLFTWIAAGQLKVKIGAEFALEEAQQAHEALEGRKTTGKVLIIP